MDAERVTTVMQVVASPSVRRGEPIGINGPERRTANLIKHWNTEGIRPIVCYPPHGRLWNVFQASGETVVPFMFRNRLDFRSVFQLTRTAREYEVDVLHSQGPPSLDLITCVAAKLCRRRVVITRPVMISDITTFSSWRRAVYQAIDKITLSACDELIAVSKRGAAQMAALQGKSRRVHVVYNGVDLQRFGAVDSLRGQAKRMNAPLVVGMTAQLTTQKGWLNYLKILQRLYTASGNVRGLIVGDGPMKKELVQLARSMSLESVVDFAGFHQDVAPMLAKMDLFLFTSKWEGLSVAIIEAMAAGLPVVASNVGAIHEQVEHGKNGYVFEVDDLDGMTRACECLLADPATRAQMGRSSYERAMAVFSEQRMLLEYANLYKGIC